jgi:predicted ATPase/DNA-binding SARP family transcriptional activator
MPAQRLVIRLFGSPSMEFDGKPWKNTAPPRALPLLAMIAAKRATPLTRAFLASTLWPDMLDGEARANLRRHVYRLERSLPQIDGVEWIARDDRSVLWNDRAPAWIDVRAFEDAIADPARLAEACDCYRGELLAGYYDEFVLGERERLRGTYIKALASLTCEARTARDYGAALGFAGKLLAADEWREDTVREWMTAAYESGDRSGALAAYERFARRLHAEFSTDPVPETIALRDTIRAGLPIAEPTEVHFEQRHGESASRAWKLPFVGRTDALDRLRSAWSRAARRSGSVAFVSGEAGIGKSRLSAELTALARDQGGHVLIGNTANPEAEPYQTIATALRPALPQLLVATAAGEPWLAALAHVFPEIASGRPEPHADGASNNERARDRLFEAFLHAFEELAKVRPLCLLLEDLHWAGQATVDLLGVLARRIGTLPILIVATYRSEESASGHPIRSLRSALVAERRATAIPLERLAAEDIAIVVGSIESDGVASVALGDAVATLSEGNPLFVAQLLEGYRETHVVPDASTALLTIGDAIAERADRLDPAVRAVAEVAATLGERFRADIVADIGGWDETVVLDAVGALTDRALVREAGSGILEYVFTHALVGAAFYEMTPPDVRAARHRRAAQVLERVCSGDGASASAIARHWKCAGERERAGASYARAARAALDVYARDEAIAYGRAALECGGADPDRFEVLRIILAAEERSEHVEQWRLDLDEFDAIARRLDDAARFAALSARERYYAQTGDRESQTRFVDAMMDLAAEAGNVPWQIDAGDARGLLQVGLGQFREATVTFRQALTLALALGERRRISRVRQHLAQALMRAGETAAAATELDEQRAHCATGASAEERLDLLWAESSLALATEDGDFVLRVGTDMLELGTQLADQEAQAKAHWLLAWAAGVRRDVAGVRKHYADAAVLFERLRQPQSLAATYINLGVLEHELGFFDRAIDYWERGATLAEQTDTRNVLGFAVSNISDAQRLQGNLDKALATARRALDIARPTGDQRLIASALGTLGAVLRDRGERAEGLTFLRESLDIYRASGARQSLLENLRAIVDGLLADGDGEELRRCADELTRLFEEDTEGQKNPTHALLTLAKVARLYGDIARAEAYEKRGRNTLARLLAELADEQSRAAFAALPHNRELAATGKRASGAR